MFDTLCTIGASDTGAACDLILEHHTYNSLTDTWVKSASKPQPFIKITVGICQDGPLSHMAYLMNSPQMVDHNSHQQKHRHSLRTGVFITGYHLLLSPTAAAERKLE